MPRLIDAEKLWKAITTRIEEYCDIADLIEIIETQPTVGVMFDNAPIAKQKHGHWKKSYISAWHSSDDNDHLYLYCSSCGERIELQGVPAEKMKEEGKLFKDCPWCGAKMDEVEDGN